MSTPPLAPGDLPPAPVAKEHGDCPHCGATTLRGQEYCLECGGRLPPSAESGAHPVGGRVEGWGAEAVAGVVAVAAGARVREVRPRARSLGQAAIELAESCGLTLLEWQKQDLLNFLRSL